MNDFKVKYYLAEFIKIKLGNSRGLVIKAKPLYLLAIIDCINDKTLCNNKIYLEDANIKTKYELEHSLFCNGIKISPFILPFYHLATSSFYSVKWKGKPFIPHPKAHSPSMLYLRENVDFAKLDDDLWMLLQNALERELLRNQLLDFYFNNR